jgi:hypothetical protein
MPRSISRRTFAGLGLGAGLAFGRARAADDDKNKPATPPSPVEAPFHRDYPAPSFKPSWKKPQISRQFAQDFVIYAHSDLPMVKTLIDRDPAVLNAAIDWGGGDWETGLGGASHMGRRDIVEYLLARGARVDLFCAAMMGRLDAVKSLLTLQPALIDAKGPHGFTLHFHAQVGGAESQPVLDYLQSLKKIEMKPNPFLKKAAQPAK